MSYKPDAALSATYVLAGGRPTDGSAHAMTPNPIRPAVTITAGTPGQYPVWLSRDRATLFAGGTQVTYSTDDGVSWSQNSHVFADTIIGVRDLDDGEILVSTYTAGGTGALFRSSGWASNRATAAFSQVKAASSADCYFDGNYGLSVYGQYVLAAEYGSKIAGANARYLYLSSDYGATWRTVYDLGGAAETHLHGCCFDPFSHRLWVAHGDVTNDVFYSDDLGSTWGTVTYQDTGLKNQVTTIIALRDCVLFLSDSAPNGVHRWRRDTGGGTPVLEQAYRFDSGSTISHIGEMAYHVPGGPALLAFSVDGTATAPSVLLATMDGFTFYELWRDTITYSGKGLIEAVGPTASGKIVGTLNDGRQVAYSTISATAPTWAASGPVRSVPARAGLYYTTPGLITTVGMGTGNNLMALPFPVARPMVVDALGVKVTGAGAAGSVIRLGIYADSGGFPGSLLVDAGTVDASAAATVEASLTVPQALTEGVYWLVAVAQNAASGAPTCQATQAPACLVGAESNVIAGTTIAGVQKGGGLVPGALPAAYPSGYIAAAAVPRVYAHCLYAL